MSEENKAITRRIFEEVWGAHNADSVEKYFAAGFINHPELPGVPQGAEGIKALVSLFAGAFSDEEQVIEDQIAEGDRVVTRWSTTGATGKRVKTTAITIYRFEGGKAVEGWSEYNSLEAMQQLGVVPTPGG
jgi:predicted SnoaL-like aldol condensation-catalyzing enzyme